MPGCHSDCLNEYICVSWSIWLSLIVSWESVKSKGFCFYFLQHNANTCETFFTVNRFWEFSGYGKWVRPRNLKPDVLLTSPPPVSGLHLSCAKWPFTFLLCFQVVNSEVMFTDHFVLSCDGVNLFCQRCRQWRWWEKMHSNMEPLGNCK